MYSKHSPYHLTQIIKVVQGIYEILRLYDYIAYLL